jgi:hypothetical protein
METIYRFVVYWCVIKEDRTNGEAQTFALDYWCEPSYAEVVGDAKKHINAHQLATVFSLLKFDRLEITTKKLDPWPGSEPPYLQATMTEEDAYMSGFSQGWEGLNTRHINCVTEGTKARAAWDRGYNDGGMHGIRDQKF